ncbi:MAG: hypothetical protein R6U89_02300 [Dehalococcoidia bacterium]
MKSRPIPTEFSVITLTPQSRREKDISLPPSRSNAVLAMAIPPNARSHFFRDLATGTSLCINTNNTFRLIDPDGYSTGVVWAQQMVFKEHDVSVWHQDQRFSFTCHASLRTGFCFGWLIDRLYSRSYRVLDPGRVV